MIAELVIAETAEQRQLGATSNEKYSCSALPISFESGELSFAFTLCEHEYMNVAPPSPN